MTQDCPARMWRLGVISLALLWTVASCVTPTVNRQDIAVDPLQPVCVPIPAALAPGSMGPASNEAYYLTIGLLELEQGTPNDDAGTPGYFVSVHRRDPAIEERIRDAEEQRQRFRDALDEHNHRMARLTGDGDAASTTTQAIDDGGDSVADEKTDAESAEDRQAREELLAALNERLNDTARELDAARSRVTDLRRMVSAETPILSRSGTMMTFRYLPIPFRIYEGDTIEVAVIEHDPFMNDRLGDTEFVVDSEMLETGHLVLSTGWVQSLSVGFVPCDAQRGVR